MSVGQGVSAASQAELDTINREARLPQLAAQVEAARAAMDEFPKYPATARPDDQGVMRTPDGGAATKVVSTQFADAYAASIRAYDNARQAFLDEQQSIGEAWANIARFKEDQRQHNESVGLDTATLTLERDKALQMAGYYDAQAKNWEADRAQKQAEAEYTAAYNEAFTPEEKAAHDQKVLAAQAKLDAANATLISAQATAQQQANAVGPQVADANRRVLEAQAKSDEAYAGAAPAKAGGEAAQAVGEGQVATARGAHADEAVRTEIAAAAARGDLDQASALEILSLLENKKAYGTAQIQDLQAQTAQRALETQQLAQGDVATKINQYSRAIQAGDMTPQDADRAMEDYLSGSTAFQRQTQREAQISGAMNTAIQAGMVVPRGQQFLPGAEPGGAYQQAFAGLGAPMPSVPLTDQQTPQQYVAAQGIQTAESVAPARFGPQGALPIASQVAQPMSMVSAQGQVPIQEVTAAQLLGQPAQAAAPVVQPAATGGTFTYPAYSGPPIPQTPYVLPQFGGVGGSAQGGWSGMYPPGTMAPLSPIGTVPYAIPPLGPEQAMARGGSALVPPAMAGMGQTPKVTKPNLFATQRPGRPSMFGGR